MTTLATTSATGTRPASLEAMPSERPTAESDALREAVNDAVANTLGRYRDIGIGPERTAFREDVVAAIMRVIPPDE